jgi:hypothetical protein
VERQPLHHPWRAVWHHAVRCAPSTTLPPGCLGAAPRPAAHAPHKQMPFLRHQYNNDRKSGLGATYAAAIESTCLCFGARTCMILSILSVVA